MAVQERQAIVSLLVLATLLVTDRFSVTDAHGMLTDPPGRGTMWRYGFNVPPDYNDNGLNCGGITVSFNLLI